MSGWLAPMYGAGALEARNVEEYEAAARFAAECGRGEWVDRLLGMAEVEWDHEAYFRRKCETHWMRWILPLWALLPPREQIRADFVRFEATRDNLVAGGLEHGAPARRAIHASCSTVL